MCYFHISNLIVQHSICLSKYQLYHLHSSKLNHWNKYQDYSRKHIPFNLLNKPLNIYHRHFH